MNVELLERVKQHILEEPLRLEMGEGLMFRAPGTERRAYYTDSIVQTPVCGTVGCIAGWACLLTDKNWDDTSWDSIRFRARELIGLNYWQSSRLFYMAAWSAEFKERYIATTTPAERAQVTAERIDAFIKSNGEV